MNSQRIPNYQIQRTIGHGVFGFVFEAWDPTNSRLVALKRVQKKTNQISREYQVLMELQGCQNIVQMVDFFYSKNDSDDLIQNMVFEHMENNLENSLRQLISKQKLMDENLLKWYMYQCLAGLEEMHKRSICHRDLKPENILINGNNLLKICDFGSAKVLSQESDNTPYVVTQFYRAPELVMSHTKYNTSIDIWAMGCIFFELATLRILFHGKSEGDQLFKMLEILGTPNDATLDYLLEQVQQKKELRKRMVGFKRSDLKAQFSHLACKEEFFNLITSMIQLDPINRITSKDALEHVIFRNCYDIQ